jgi:hypothetical protein
MCGKSVIEQVQEEREQKSRDEARRPQLRQRLESWRGRGYIVARLLKVVDGDVPTAEKVFSGFETDVGRLSEAQLRLNALDVMGFPNEVMALRQKLNDPDAAGQAEQMVEDLAQKIKVRKEEEKKRLHEQALKEKAAKMAAYRQRIAGWAAKGYSTKRFEGLLEDPDSDSIAIERKLDDYDRDVQKLLELRKALDSVRGVATEAEAKELDAQLLDPDALAAAHAGVDGLSERFYQKKSEQEKLGALRARFEEYKQKGYKVGRLEAVAGRQLSEAEPVFTSYEEDVGSLFKLWDRLRALDRSLFPDEWEAARSSMNDPDRVAELQKTVEALETRQSAEQEKRAEEDRKLALTARQFVAGVFEKMKKYTPDYLPLGFYLRDARWEPHLAPDGLFAKGEVRPGLLSKGTGVVACGFAPALQKQGILTEAEGARAAGQYVAHCFVLTRVSAEMAELARTFLHQNMSVYIQDLSAGSLLFNAQDPKTQAYSEWFVPDMAVSGMKGAVRAVSDKHGIFTRAVLQERLGLQQRESDELLKEWMGRNEIVQVSRIRDEYSFMD